MVAVESFSTAIPPPMPSPRRRWPGRHCRVTAQRAVGKRETPAAAQDAAADAIAAGTALGLVAADVAGGNAQRALIGDAAAVAAELPLTVQCSAWPCRWLSTPPPLEGGVAADGAVGQRGCAVVRGINRPPPSPEAVLPLTVQSVSVAVPLYSL